MSSRSWVIVAHEGTILVDQDDNVTVFEWNRTQAKEEGEYAREKLLELTTLVNTGELPEAIASQTAQIIQEHLWGPDVDDQAVQDFIAGVDDERFARTNIDVMGLSEVMEATGMSDERVTSLARNESSDFPAPIKQLKCGPVWNAHAVRLWVKRGGAGPRPGPKLTPEQRLEIATAEGTVADVAARYGVSHQTVRNLRKASQG